MFTRWLDVWRPWVQLLRAGDGCLRDGMWKRWHTGPKSQKPLTRGNLASLRESSRFIANSLVMLVCYAWLSEAGMPGAHSLVGCVRPVPTWLLFAAVFLGGEECLKTHRMIFQTISMLYMWAICTISRDEIAKLKAVNKTCFYLLRSVAWHVRDISNIFFVMCKLYKKYFCGLDL